MSEYQRYQGSLIPIREELMKDDLRDLYKERPGFQACFQSFVRSHMRRPAFLKRLHDNRFSLP